MLKIAELSNSKEALKEKALKYLADCGIGCEFDENKTEKVRIVFAGQYSAGKSSIIKMLTGDDSIATGAKITTEETHTYEWNGLEIVDTPGVHTSLRPDHDEISYKAIASADILVFVVTNELFDSYIADHFRHLAIDKDKAGEMILVVNKMDRAAKGNTAEQQNIIREALRPVLAPYTPEQLHLSFLDAQSYLDSVEEREEDPELADELLERSGYESFIETLNQFVKEKTLSSKLTTDLYVLDNVLDKAISELTPGSEDADIDALEENLKQQRFILLDTRSRMQREVKDIFSDASSQIRQIGLDAATYVDSDLSQDELEEIINQQSKKAEEIVDNVCKTADDHVHSGFLDLNQSFVEMESTEFNQKLKINLVDKYDKFPESIKKVFITATDLEKQGNIIVESLAKSKIPEALSLSESSINALGLTGNVQHHLQHIYSGSKVANNIGKVGHIASKASAIIRAVSFALETALQIKEEYEEQLLIDARKKNRQNIRSAFNNLAKDLEDYASDYVKQCVVAPLEQSVRSIENNISELRDARAGRSEKCIKLEKIQKEIQALISGIHEIEE